MTTDWEKYHDVILSLYEQHSLATVRQIMLDKYGFHASIRAYRGRLDRWGVRKYNRKRGRGASEERSDAGPSRLQEAGSEDTSASQRSLDISPSIIATSERALSTSTQPRIPHISSSSNSGAEYYHSLSSAQPRGEYAHSSSEK